ncbi:hypothetical protein [Acinetobacter nosocomialis]|uniref:hypothetical protein n=1 Tax=Acinetobacter nosocomialis TaxID=106654 RepID=UPI0025A1B6FA|nr:hypothetical protein [Acinetobacter nosocomialis]
MTRQFNPVTDHAEFHKLVHDLEPIKSEFKQLLDDYKYLNDRFNDAENPITDGELDWWGIIHFKLEGIYKLINKEFIDTFGADKAVDIKIRTFNEKSIADLYEKIHDRKKLGIENDPVITDLYKLIKEVKSNIGRE